MMYLWYFLLQRILTIAKRRVSPAVIKGTRHNGGGSEALLLSYYHILIDGGLLAL